MRVELSAAEVALAYQIAANRQTVNEAAKIAEARRDGRSTDPGNLHRLGALAEIAFAKRYNLFPDLSAHPRSGTADFVVNGKRVDVKGRPRPEVANSRGLVVQIKKKVTDADIYVLGFVDGNVVEFAGWAFSHELINDSTIRDLGYGPTYVLERSQLRKFPEDEEVLSA